MLLTTPLPICVHTPIFVDLAHIYTVYGLVCTRGFVKGKLTDSEHDFVLLVSPSSGKFCLHV